MQPFHRSGTASATTALREFLAFKARGFIVSMARTADGWEVVADPRPVRPRWLPA
jgi:hypothetical protein